MIMVKLMLDKELVSSNKSRTHYSLIEKNEEKGRLGS